MGDFFVGGFENHAVKQPAKLCVCLKNLKHVHILAMLFVMSNRSDKPKHSASDLVCKMWDEKGVTFSQITEKEAERYLSDVNNFLRIASYRKNYEKNPAGKNKGKYLNLDFAYLVDLSSIDMQLRYLILKMTIDIEHALKVRLLKNIEKDDLIGGYAVVSAFLSRNEKIVNKIGQTANSAYTSNLIAKYFTIDSKTRKITDFTDCPVWVLRHCYLCTRMLFLGTC